MALNPEDTSGGFQHHTVVAFINEKMARHAKGPEFYLENIILSWEEVEDKLRAILETSEVPSEAKEACAWGSLALGVRFGHRQRQLHGRRVQWLHDFARLHKSAAQALASDLKLLTAQMEMERKEAAFRLQLAQASLAEVQKERDLLRSPWEPVAEGPGLATAPGAGTEGAGEKEEEASATATAATAFGAVGGRGSHKDAERAEAEELSEDLNLMQLLGAVDQKDYTSGRQKQGDLGSTETAMFYFPETLEPKPTVSPEHLPVQLPASFTYSYSCPLLPFSESPTPSPPTSSPPTATFTAAAPSTHWGPFNVSTWSDMGAQGLEPQEPQRDRRDSDPHPQIRPPVFRRPGHWDCPWCKAVNFSRREICFRCGKGIWLQTPQ
uniref:RanBP2-type domain-containing protein n=1 Tax=Catagonus wagneri TaxID=51154 RepID=A0A8C3WJF4_9CETA